MCALHGTEQAAELRRARKRRGVTGAGRVPGGNGRRVRPAHRLALPAALGTAGRRQAGVVRAASSDGEDGRLRAPLIVSRRATKCNHRRSGGLRCGRSQALLPCCTCPPCAAQVGFLDRQLRRSSQLLLLARHHTHFPVLWGWLGRTRERTPRQAAGEKRRRKIVRRPAAY